ncbi:MAG: hypothetical protein JNM62_16275 [Flavobacteriales bacterium]|nr:hypothetical protein [Flavobacteriales bacterium]
MIRTALPVVALLSALAMQGQRAPVFQWQGYGPEQGLSNRHVTAIIQDQVGFVWVGTVSGLDRFDGHSFRNWSLSDGVSGARVDALRRDGAGLIWVFATSAENDITNLDILDPATGTIRSLPERFPELPFDPAQLVRFGPQRQDGTISLGAASPARSIRYDRTRGFIVQQLDGARFEPLGDDRMGLIIGHLVKSDGQQQIVQVDTSGAVRVMQELIPGSFVEAMITGRRSHGALYKVTVPKEAPRYYDTYSEMVLDQRSLDSELPISRAGDPIHRPVNFTPLPDHGLRVEDSRIMDGDDRTLFDLSALRPEIGGRVKDCMVDRRGDPWMATEFGLFHIELRKDVFQRSLYETPVIAGMGVLCRGMAAKGNDVYLSTEWQGAYVLRDSADGMRVEKLPEPQYLFASHIAQDGTWWRGGTGVVVSETPDGRTRTYRVDDRIWNILADVDGGVLLGGLRGLQRLDVASGKFTDINDARYPELRNAHVMHLQRTSDGGLLAATSKGLYRLTTGGRVEKRWWSGAEGRDRLPYHDLHHCHVDADGIMWLSTRGAGLVRFEPTTGRHQRYTMRNGFPNNMVYAAYEDDNDQLWLPTDGGIVRFDKHTRQSAVFTTADGITHDEFNRLAHTRTADGTLYFGGLNGITSFHPDAFKPGSDQQQFPLVLTRVQHYSNEQQGLVDRTTETVASEGIQLGVDEGSMQVSFALLSFEGKGRVLYAWRLAGVEDDWNYQHEPSVRLDRLPYGEHVLEVKARDGFGYWSVRTLEVPIRVERPWHAYRAVWVGVGALVAVLLTALFTAGRRGRQRRTSARFEAEALSEA